MKIYFVPLAVACAMAATTATAQSKAVGVSIGTPGVGVVATAQVSELVVLRGAVDGMSLNRNETYSDVAYDGKAKLLTGGVFADIHPGGGPFFVSGGAYAGKRKLELRGQPTANVEIGDVVYTPAQVGRINGDAKLSSFQPFVGLGFDNTYAGDRDWGFRVLAGVSFSKAPKINLTATGGTLSNDPAFLAELREEEAEVREDAKDFKYFPVIQLGLTRRF